MGITILNYLFGVVYRHIIIRLETRRRKKKIPTVYPTIYREKYCCITGKRIVAMAYPTIYTKGDN